jgi:hypothetical protein
MSAITQVEIRSPMCITSRLMAGVRLGNVEISITPSSNRDHYGKTIWHWYIDGEGLEASGDDLAGWGDHREMMGSMLSFLSACGEGLSYQERTGNESDNADLFPPDVASWCATHSDELSMLGMEIEESND